MLIEFAFTPSIFDDQVNSDEATWQEQLAKLAERMFPAGYPWPVIVANLHGGTWKHEANRQIQKISNHRIKTDAMKLFSMIDKVLIERPAFLDWPDDQLAWCKEAIGSGKTEPIDRIVACRFAMGDLEPTLKPVRCISEVKGSGFWSGIPADDSPLMEIDHQIKQLNKLSFHAGFLCLVTPHINGGGDDESDFAIELVRSAYRKPSGTPRCLVEIHTEGPRDSVPGDVAFEKFVSGVRGKISHDLGTGFRYTLVFWPKLLDRLVIAGDLTEDADRNQVKRPRWAISMSHIARRVDKNKALPPTEWKLLKIERVRSWSAIFCKEPLSGCLSKLSVTT